MTGMEFAEPVAPLRNKLIGNHKIFTGASSDKNVMRLLPPLTLKQEHADEFIEGLALSLGA